jgi:WD40 repeat protein
MESITSAAISGDGRHIVTGSRDKTAVLWDTASGKKIQTFRGHTGGVSSVALSRDGNVVLSGSIDGTANLWPAIASSPGRGTGQRSCGMRPAARNFTPSSQEGIWS